jgi:RNA polymerase sigma factor (sigma-70 family)
MHFQGAVDLRRGASFSWPGGFLCSRPRHRIDGRQAWGSCAGRLDRAASVEIGRCRLRYDNAGMGVSARPVAIDCSDGTGRSDDELVARVRAGDDAAFEAIFDRYADGVLAFCAHMLRSRDGAEDALQLTFVSAYRALRDGDGCVSLRPWLYTIARNRCLSELRVRRDVVDLDGVVGDRACFDGPSEQVQRREELRELVADMQRLPIDQRAALVLFELGDHSQAEIATVLGVRSEKVKALIFQAREALVRGRKARDSPCEEIRERLATVRGRILPRSMTRAHIERCPSCAAFEAEMRRQRAALALILPVIATGELKASVLGSALSGSGVAAAAGATGSGTVAVGGATIAGGGTTAGGVKIGRAHV